jgi:hypothetical protein
MTWSQMLVHEPQPRGVGDKVKCKQCEGPIPKEENPYHDGEDILLRPDVPPEVVQMRHKWFEAQRELRATMRALARVRTPDYPQGIRLASETIEYDLLKWRIEALLSGILTEEQRFGIENEFMVKEVERLQGMLELATQPIQQLATPQGKKLFVAGPGWTPSG